MATKTKMTVEEIERHLAHFTGTQEYLRYNPALFPKVILTEGARFVAEELEAFWLMDIIASYQPELSKDPEAAYMQFWTLKVEQGKHGRSAVVICERDTDDEILRQVIDLTDFPLDEIKFYVSLADEDGTMVVMLPSEY